MSDVCGADDGAGSVPSLMIASTPAGPPPESGGGPPISANGLGIGDRRGDRRLTSWASKPPLLAPRRDAIRARSPSAASRYAARCRAGFSSACLRSVKSSTKATPGLGVTKHTRRQHGHAVAVLPKYLPSRKLCSFPPLSSATRLFVSATPFDGRPVPSSGRDPSEIASRLVRLTMWRKGLVSPRMMHLQNPK